MPVKLIVGGQSESAYFRAVLQQSHPWADLDKVGVQVLSANGDSKIPLLVTQGRENGKKVMVLYDQDALSRAHEQASVIEDEDVVTHELRSDFEASFDPEIMHAAMEVLGYDAEIECLRKARLSGNTFAVLETCAHATAKAKPFGKAQLAEALGSISYRTWYVPEEIFATAIRLGELCGITPWADERGWSKEATDSIEATGRLYVSSHVSNDTVGYWDFERDVAGSISLPETFDGRVAICRAGRRFVMRKFERDKASSLPLATWVHVFDRVHDTLTLSFRFRVWASVHELQADEDGNHLELHIQTATGEKSAFRCLADGTQRQDVKLSRGDYLYSARTSRNGRLTASGPQPVTVSDRGCEVVVLPHFYGCGYTWSPCNRFLAFFGRRWHQHKSQDFLWLLNLDASRIHRVGTGDRFIPAYWC